MAEEQIEKARPRSEFVEIGQTGLEHTGGMVREEFLTDLQGKKSVKVYKEMRDNDAIIGAVLFALENLVKQARWSVEPFDESPEAKKDKEFLEEAMHDMDRPWPAIISDIMSMTVFGWSFFEPVYKLRKGLKNNEVKSSKYDDGKIGWAKMPIRSQDSLDRWELGQHGEVLALVQRPAPDYQEIKIPMKRGVLFRTSSWKSNPEGRSILRNAYRTYYFKKRMEEIEGIGIERDLNGIPVIRVPPSILKEDATDEEKRTLRSAVKMGKNLRNDSQAAIVLPALYDENSNLLFDVELLTTLGRRAFDLNATIQRMNKTIATSMLADFVLIGQESVGSFALASSKTKMFSIAIGSYMDEIAGQFNRTLIPRLFALNGKDGPELPKLVHGDIETVDLDELAKFVNALSGAGLDLTGEEVREHLGSQAGLPTNSIDRATPENQPFFGVTPDGVEEDKTRGTTVDNDEGDEDEQATRRN